MNILIIGPSWVGDSVMAQSLYIQLKKKPDCNIDVFLLLDSILNGENASGC